MGKKKSSIEKKRKTDEPKLIRSLNFANPLIPLMDFKFIITQSEDDHGDFVENKLIPNLHKMFEIKIEE